MDTTTLRKHIAQAIPRAIELRHDIHRHPELMYQEQRTCQLVQRELATHNIAFKAGLAGGTGVLAYLPAKDGPKDAPSVALRADMDALPIDERTGVPYASATPGVMHACGHDGHTATLLAAAAVLAKLDHRPNPVTFIFQPAEEGGAGGRRMCEDGALDGSALGPRAARVFGLHGWTDLALGNVATRPGRLLAATDDFDITIAGKQGHAAMPHMSVDPIVCAAHIVAALQTIASRTVDPLDSVVVTVGRFHAGTANNVIPESARLTGTVRTLSAQTRQTAERRLREIVEHTARAHTCTANIEWKVGYPVTDNDPKLTEHWRRVATDTLGADRVEHTPAPFMGGEDFAFYAQHAPACFFLLGLQRPGDTNPARLHTPEFDFNDDAMLTGVELFCTLALAQND